MKHRKPKADRKGDALRIRLTEGQKIAMTEAARKAGLDLSNWIRFIALREIGSNG